MVESGVERKEMKQLNVKIDVCPECPYYDDTYAEFADYEAWCFKSQREVMGLNPPEWCVLEECYDAR